MNHSRTHIAHSLTDNEMKQFQHNNIRINKSNNNYRQPKHLLNKKMKTIQSIGTFNQTPLNFDQSIVISKRDLFVPNPFLIQDKSNNQYPIYKNQYDQQIEYNTNRRLNTNTNDLNYYLQQNNTQISRIQSDINQISRMKYMFQSKINHNKQYNNKHNKSIQKHNTSIQKNPNTKSIEKHILKPTNTPNFNKFQNKKYISHSLIQTKPNQLIFNQSISNGQQIQTQSSKFKQKPLIIQYSFKNKQNKQKIKQNQQKDKQNQQQIKYTPSNIVQNSSKKSEIDCSQISSKFQQYQFQYQRSSQSKISQQNQHVSIQYSNQINKSTTPKKINFSQSKINQLTPISDIQIQSKCNCQPILKLFMQQTNNKIAQITSKLIYLEQQNIRLTKLQNKFNQQNQLIKRYQSKTQLIQNQCTQLRQSNYSCQVQKEQLQSLLKQILFKRQKQKYQKSSCPSKQNTYRNQFDHKISTKTDKMTSRNQSTYKNQNSQNDFVDQFIQNKNDSALFKKDIKNSKKIVEPLGMRVGNIQNRQDVNLQQSRNGKQIDTKMKVQNLLSKLQIKIQKS